MPRPELLKLLPPHGSFSQLSTWQECEVRYRIEKVYNPVETPAWWFISGSAFHTATEVWDQLRRSLGSDLYGHEALLGLYEDRLSSEITDALEREPDQSKWRASGPPKYKQTELFFRKHAEAWCQLYADQADDTTIHEFPDGTLAIECRFDVELGGIPVTGFIDRLRILDGQLLVEDIKTGSTAGDPDQLGLYAVVSEMAFGERPALGRFWNPRKDGAQAAISLDHYTKDYFAYQFEQFELRRKQDPKPAAGFTCSKCSVRDYCPFVFGSKAVEL